MLHSITTTQKKHLTSDIKLLPFCIVKSKLKNVKETMRLFDIDSHTTELASIEGTNSKSLHNWLYLIQVYNN